MMIAPILSGGLKIDFTTEISSRPYISLTAEIMQTAGIEATITDHEVKISPQPFRKVTLQADADWSAASYWFSMAALARDSNMSFSKLRLNSHQGDKIIAEWCEDFGAKIKQESDCLLLYFNNPAHPNNPENPSLLFDFTHYPDLAQTMIVLCAAKSIRARFTGLQSLRIKETDRITALQNELLKFGVTLFETESGVFTLSGIFTMSHQTVSTYGDHRMAMAFAPLALLGSITIEHPEVVEKSYPDFWREMEKVGFEIS
jgi:3-phosphoshikimate 1-carboxyvinyltransferase